MGFWNDFNRTVEKGLKQVEAFTEQVTPVVKEITECVVVPAVEKTIGFAGEAVNRTVTFIGETYENFSLQELIDTTCSCADHILKGSWRWEIADWLNRTCPGTFFQKICIVLITTIDNVWSIPHILKAKFVAVDPEKNLVVTKEVNISEANARACGLLTNRVVELYDQQETEALLKMQMS